MSGTFLGKAIFVIATLIMSAFGIIFVVNKDDINSSSKDVEIITSLNVDTYDHDLYIYNVSDNTLFASEYFYNKIYLDNNEVTYDEYKFDNNSKFYLKNLSNTAVDVNNIKITYDPITLDEFKYLLENYNLLKIYIWLNDNGVCEKILLYSNNNIELDLEGF